MSGSLIRGTAAAIELLLFSTISATAADSRLEALDSLWRQQQIQAYLSGLTASGGGIKTNNTQTMNAQSLSDAESLSSALEERGVLDSSASGKASHKDGVYSNNTVGKSTVNVASRIDNQAPTGTYKLALGTFIPALLLTGLNSDLPGYLVAQVSANIYDSATGRVLLIPQGTRLFGKYDSKVVFGQKRPLVAWSKLIFPDASTVDLDAMPGADRAGYNGFKAHVNQHYSPMLTTAVIASVFSGLAEAFDDDDTSTVTVSNPTITLSDSIPVGGIIGYVGSTAPDGWHLCDGSSITDDDLAEELGMTSYPSLSASSSIVYIIKTETATESLSQQLALAGLSSSNSKVLDDAGNEIGGEIAEMIGQMATQLFAKQLARAPTLVVKPGYKLHAVVNQELFLPAWTE